MAQVDGCTPMDVSELEPCALCGKGLMHANDLAFYEVTARQCVIDLANVRRMHGLELAMGGAAPLARIFSPDNTVAQRVGAPRRSLVCQSCALRPVVPAQLVETD